MQVKFLGSDVFITWNVTHNSTLPITYSALRRSFFPDQVTNRTINFCLSGDNSCLATVTTDAEVIYCIQGYNKFGNEQICSKKLNGKKEGNCYDKFQNHPYRFMYYNQDTIFYW